MVDKLDKGRSTAMNSVPFMSAATARATQNWAESTPGKITREMLGIQGEMFFSMINGKDHMTVAVDHERAEDVVAVLERAGYWVEETERENWMDLTIWWCEEMP